MMLTTVYTVLQPSLYATPVNVPAMSTLKERLTRAMAHAKKDNQSKLAREVGVTRAAVSKWMSTATTSLQTEHAFRVARYLGVNPQWLATGEGTMLETEDPDRALIDAAREEDPTFASFLQDYRKLSSVEKTMVRTVVVSLARAHDPIYQAFEKDQRAINRKRDGKRAAVPAKSNS